jgi:hypothetical protein
LKATNATLHGIGPYYTDGRGGSGDRIGKTSATRTRASRPSPWFFTHPRLIQFRIVLGVSFAMVAVFCHSQQIDLGGQLRTRFLFGHFASSWGPMCRRHRGSATPIYTGTPFSFMFHLRRDFFLKKNEWF